MGRVGANVGGANQPVARELALDGEIPFVDCRCCQRVMRGGVGYGQHGRRKCDVGGGGEGAGNGLATPTNARRAGIIVGVPESPISHVVLQNVSIQAANPLVVRNLCRSGPAGRYCGRSRRDRRFPHRSGRHRFRSPKTTACAWVIRVKPGLYYEQIRIPRNKPFVTPRDDNAPATVLVYDAAAATAGGTSKSGSVYVHSNDFIFHSGEHHV